MRKLLLLFLVMQVALVSFGQMTDEQVVTMLREAQSQGKSQEEMIVLLTQKGVTREQLERIRANYNGNVRDSIVESGQTSRVRTEIPRDTVVGVRFNRTEKQVFGREIFTQR